jgi:hypothetical protein
MSPLRHREPQRLHRETIDSGSQMTFSAAC